MPPSSGQSTFAPESAPVRCPQCGASFSTPLSPIVSAADKEAQSRLLSGTLNVATCPACGTQNRVGGPMLYFDLSNETALVLVPDSMALSHEDQEKAIGRLTNRVVEGLPAEERRMYLLQPRMFFTEATFMEAVLESVGVRPEDMRKAQESAILVEDLLGLATTEAVRGRLAAAGREDDTRLVSLTTALAEEAMRAGDRRRAEALMGLRERLLEITGPPTISLEELIQELIAARDAGELPALVAAVRQVLGYEFFAALTELIEAEEDDDVRAELESLRTDLLAATDALDAEAEAELGRAARRLEAVLLAPDPKRLLEEQSDSVDETFLMVTEANLRMAAEQGRVEEAAKLERVLDAALAVVESRLPPHIKLVNQLARSEDEASRRALLDAEPELVNEDLLAILLSAADRARSGGATPVADALDSAAEDVGLRLGAPKGIAT